MDFDTFAEPSGLDELIESQKAPFVQADAWVVIQSYFDEKGLVRQQLDSFDEFVQHTILDVINDTPTILLKPTQQYGTQSVSMDVRIL